MGPRRNGPQRQSPERSGVMAQQQNPEYSPADKEPTQTSPSVPSEAGLTETSQMNNVPPMGGLNQTLEIELVEASRERVVMKMPVTARHHQPWGFLHGGASLALAESAATVGAFLNCPPGMGAFGQQINANHLRSLRQGVLTATATPLHVGHTSQVW